MLSLPLEHQQPSAWHCPLEGQHSLSHQANALISLIQGVFLLPYPGQGAQEGSKHPCGQLGAGLSPATLMYRLPPVWADLGRKQPNPCIHPQSVLETSRDKGSQCWEREMSPSLPGSSSRQC